MKREYLNSILLCGALFFSYIPLNAAEGLWLNSPGLDHSIQVPAGWPISGVRGSLTPPGMAHLFFLVAKGSAFAVDIARQQAPGKDSMPADEYFDMARQVARSPALQKARLSDKSELQYFKSVEETAGKKEYFIQGILVKSQETYYITISSPRSHPGAAEWRQVLGALSSLRTGASSALGKKVDLKKGKTGSR